MKNIVSIKKVNITALSYTTLFSMNLFRKVMWKKVHIIKKYKKHILKNAIKITFSPCGL